MFNELDEGRQSPCDINNLFDISLDLLVTAGTDGSFKILNPAWESILGWSLDELRNRPYMDFVHPDDIEKTLMEVRHIKSGRNSTNFSNRYRCKDGSYRWLLWSTMLKDGYFHAAARDITEIKEQEQLLREISEMGNLGGWSYDVVAERLSLDAQAYQLIALPNGIPIDIETALSFVLEPGRHSLREQLEAALNGGDGFDMELEFVDARGRRGWFRIKSKPVHGNQNTLRLIGLLQDITEKKDTERRLLERQTHMLQSSKMAALGEMAGGIAHEINTPLGVILLRAGQMIRLLTTAPNKVDEAIDIARVIGGTAEKIACIIRGLRAFARSGEQDPFEFRSLSSILEETTTLCSSTFLNSGINLLIDPIPCDVVLECRPVQIVQVLLNLLSNSKSALNQSVDASKWVRIQCLDAGEIVRIRILDSGPGIPHSIRARIMDPFFTTKKVGEGTGLGLSISKGIVEGHQGSLYLETGSPQTCFVVDLPKRQTPQSRASARFKDTSPDESKDSLSIPS